MSVNNDSAVEFKLKVRKQLQNLARLAATFAARLNNDNSSAKPSGKSDS